jgi:AraC-like DNA-binding protein/extradiol dioxygenase family protein
MKLGHATIVTEDPESARRFLCAIVGLSEGPRPPFSVNGHWLYANGQPVIHLIEEPGASRATSASSRIDHVGLPFDTAQEWSALLDRIQVSRVPYEIREVPLCGERQLFVLVARLVQDHVSPSPAQAFSRIAQEGLDRRRLSRVLDYIQAHLESDLTVDQLAGIACLSRFHFARAFKASTGQSPHRYVSAKRLERAKALLIRGDRSLIDIALTLSFSCQANFTRAFRRATGRTPGQYRRSFRSSDESRREAPVVGRLLEFGRDGEPVVT